MVASRGTYSPRKAEYLPPALAGRLVRAAAQPASELLRVWRGLEVGRPGMLMGNELVGRLGMRRQPSWRAGVGAPVQMRWGPDGAG